MTGANAFLYTKIDEYMDIYIYIQYTYGDRALRKCCKCSLFCKTKHFGEHLQRFLMLTSTSLSILENVYSILDWYPADQHIRNSDAATLMPRHWCRDTETEDMSLFKLQTSCIAFPVRLRMSQQATHLAWATWILSHELSWTISLTWWCLFRWWC